MRTAIFLVGLTLAEVLGAQTGWKLEKEAAGLAVIFLLLFVIMDVWELLK